MTKVGAVRLQERYKDRVEVNKDGTGRRGCTRVGGFTHAVQGRTQVNPTQSVSCTESCRYKSGHHSSLEPGEGWGGVAPAIV